MPLKGVQNWVNGWVNVNNNHVVFHEDDSIRHQHRPSSSGGNSNNNGESNNNNNHHHHHHHHHHQKVSFGGDQNHQSRGGGNGNNNRGHSASNRGVAAEGRGMIPVMGDGRAILDSRRADRGSTSGGTTGTSGTTASTAVESASSQQPQPQPQQYHFQPFYRKSSKKVKLLKKTNSQSDLLKEKAATKRDQMIEDQQRAGGGGGGNGSGIAKGEDNKANGNVAIIDTIAGLTQHLNRNRGGYDTTTRQSSNSGSTNSTVMRENTHKDVQQQQQQQTPGAGGLGNAPGNNMNMNMNMNANNINMHPPFRSTGQYVNEKVFANLHRSSQLGTTADDMSRGASNRPRLNSNSKARATAANANTNATATNDAMNNNNHHNHNHGHGHYIPEHLHVKQFSSTKPVQNPALISGPGPAVQPHLHPHPHPHPHPSQMSIPMTANTNKTQINNNNNNGIRNSNSNDNNNNSKNVNCPHCADAEDRIQALESDLEYLRLLALQSEFVCSECENNAHTLPRVSSSASIASGKTSRSNKSGRTMTSHSIGSGKHSVSLNSGMYSSTTGGGGGGPGVMSRKNRDKRGRNFFADGGMNQRQSTLPEPIALAESSQRLIDITARYKRQIENMTRETARWQNDMHLKLSKLAMMCKDLNDESAKRKEQSDVAKSELNRVRTERDSKSSELEILRARVALYEKQELENMEIRRQLREDETDTLDMAHAAITQRDDLIQDLTTRLDDALTMLEDEREQYKQQRRRVILKRDIT